MGRSGGFHEYTRFNVEYQAVHAFGGYIMVFGVREEGIQQFHTDKLPGIHLLKEAEGIVGESSGSIGIVEAFG